MKMLESETVEFKREISSSGKMARELVAFANGKGGSLIIGYDSKTKAAVGVNNLEDTEEKIANIINDCCTPQIQYYVSHHSYQGQTLLVVDVHAGMGKPYYVTQLGMDKGSFVRYGSTTRLADRETLTRLIREGKNIAFDRETLPYPSKLLSKTRLEQYRNLRNQRLKTAPEKVSASWCEDLHLAWHQQLTVTGALLFCDEPQNFVELDHSFIRAARFRGESKSVILDQAEIMGPLTDQIEAAQKFILRNIRLQSVLEGVKRVDRYEYPQEIVRELIVNAVAHRDYSMSYRAIMVEVYDQSLRVVSPGGLAGPVTLDNLRDRQYSRNPTIARRLFEMGYLEAWGRGIDLIMDWSEAKAHRAPQFFSARDEFICEIFSEQGAPLDASLATSELAKLASFERITNRLVREKLGLSKTQAQNLLKQAYEAGRLLRHGEGRGTYYLWRRIF